MLIHNQIVDAKNPARQHLIVKAKKMSDEVIVSTVFLGLDHNFTGKPPILFETMVFGGKMDEQMERYSTWQDAEKGHKQWVGQVLEQEGSLVSVKTIS